MRIFAPPNLQTHNFSLVIYACEIEFWTFAKSAKRRVLPSRPSQLEKKTRTSNENLAAKTTLYNDDIKWQNELRFGIMIFIEMLRWTMMWWTNWGMKPIFFDATQSKWKTEIPFVIHPAKKAHAASNTGASPSESFWRCCKQFLRQGKSWWIS